MFSAAVRHIFAENSRLKGALGSSTSTSTITRPDSEDALGAEFITVSLEQQSSVPIPGVFCRGKRLGADVINVSLEQQSSWDIPGTLDGGDG